MLQKIKEAKKTLERLGKLPYSKLPWSIQYEARQAVNYLNRMETLEKLDAAGLGTNFGFSVHSIEELTIMRKKLREALGSWEDRVTGVYGNTKETIHATYQGVGTPVYIDFFFPYDEVPEGLLAEDCKIVEAGGALIEAYREPTYYTVKCGL